LVSLLFSRQYGFKQHKEVNIMNITTATQANKSEKKQIEIENCCKNIANSVNTFNRILANTSNKLGLSKAIYQR